MVAKLLKQNGIRNGAKEMLNQLIEYNCHSSIEPTKPTICPTRASFATIIEGFIKIVNPPVSKALWEEHLCRGELQTNQGEQQNSEHDWYFPVVFSSLWGIELNNFGC